MAITLSLVHDAIVKGIATANAPDKSDKQHLILIFISNNYIILTLNFTLIINLTRSENEKEKFFN